MRTPNLRRVASLLFAAVLALFLAPAGLALAAGEHVSVQVIGPDANGEPVYYAAPATYELADGEDGWTLSQRSLDDAHLTYDAENSSYGVLLNSITSPVDGAVLAYDEASGAYWQLFVDGAASEVGISGVELAEGTDLVWYYSAFGDEVPASVGTLEVADATAAAPSASFPLVPVVLCAAVAAVACFLVIRNRKNS